jgi:5'-3' exonuclease
VPAAPLLVADVPWLLYRAYFALPSSIRGAHGEPVNALLGTVNALLGAAEECGPRAVVACLGAEQAAYRVELYPPYHAHRDPMPEQLAAQWATAPSLLSSFGWTVSASERFEADDVMFSHATLEAEAGGSALLLTADRDLYGAVSERVTVLEPARRGKPAGRIGPAEVHERYGIGPALVPDLIALRGDPSDGLPGAPGVGAKTAAELLRGHGSLEGAIAAARDSPSTMTPRIARALLEHAKLLLAFKRIATLQRLDVERAPDRPTDRAGGARAAQRLGMLRLVRRLERNTPGSLPPVSPRKAPRRPA